MSACLSDGAALAANRKNTQRWSAFSGENVTDTPTEGKRTYAIIVCLFASLGGLYFGYDQGVTSGVLTMVSFRNAFCEPDENGCSATTLPPKWENFTTFYNVIYYCGCIFGAFIANFVCDLWGRRVTIFTAGLFFCTGTTWAISVSEGAHGLLYGGRFLLGAGVGMSSFSLPIFGAEMAPKELRGMLSGFMQMTVVTGLLAAGIVNYLVEIYNVSEAWRVSNGVAMLPPIIVMLGIFFVPESPRWLYRFKGEDAAKKALAKLRQTENVSVELQQIAEAIDAEGNSSIWDYSGVFAPEVIKRLIIAAALQVLQQATGINPTFTYGAQIFKKIMVGDNTATTTVAPVIIGGTTAAPSVSNDSTAEFVVLLVLFSVNFLSTIPALYWVDKYGRRTLLLVGAVGMVLGLIASAVSYTVGCDSVKCSDTAGYLMVGFTCIFIFSFAISWGPICWIYPAEIFPMHIRAKSVSISTMANWGMGIIMMFIPKLFVHLGINGVFFLFGGLCCICGTFVFFFCPETMGISLEDIELLFAGKKPEPPVAVGYVVASTPELKNKDVA